MDRNSSKSNFNWVICSFFLLLYYILVHFVVSTQFTDDIQCYFKKERHTFNSIACKYWKQNFKLHYSFKAEVQHIEWDLLLDCYGCIMICRMCMLKLQFTIQKYALTISMQNYTVHQSQGGYLNCKVLKDIKNWISIAPCAHEKVEWMNVYRFLYINIQIGQMPHFSVFILESITKSMLSGKCLTCF